MKTLTFDEFEKVYIDRPYELWDGLLVKVSPKTGLQGYVVSNLAYFLADFVRSNRLGAVLVNTGFRLTPTTLRGADIAFISNTKRKLVLDPDKFVPFAPDLAVEVVSTDEDTTKTRKKLDYHGQAGTKLVWFVYPESRQVDVWESNQHTVSAAHEGILNGGDVLPGLQIRVADLFPPEVESTE